MTAKDYVKNEHPTARIERHKSRNKIPYYLIRLGRSTMWFSEGSTAAKAWKAAKEKIIKSKESK